MLKSGGCEGREGWHLKQKVAVLVGAKAADHATAGWVAKGQRTSRTWCKLLRPAVCGHILLLLLEILNGSDAGWCGRHR